MSKNKSFNIYQENNKSESEELTKEESTSIDAEKVINEDNSNSSEKINVTANETTQPVETEKITVSKKEIQSKKGFTPVYKVELELTSYADAMDSSKSIIPEEGGKWQYSLFNTIKSVFNTKSQEEFNNEFNTILQFFNKNKNGIFNERFIFRFPEYWPGSASEFAMFRRIVYFIIQTADVKNRKKALEDINLEIVTEGFTETQKQMLFNFYSI